MKMLRAFAAALALTLGAALTAVAADPPSVAGRLNHISGPVSFAPAQANEDWSAAVINRPITTGDRLWTDAGGRAEMHVGSLAVRMGAQTSLDVLNLDDRTFQLRLAQGSMNLRVRRLGTDQLLEIATPSGAVVVRQPGSYRINVDPSGTAVVAVRAGGQAEVFTGNSSFLIRDQQQAMLSAHRQDLYAATPADEFDRWAAERDQRKDRIVSTRYVPEEMTGYEDLDDHGTWHSVPTYGPVWRPRAVPVGWAPYRHGHWVWVSPWGWTWVDDAPWGFAPSHYGRWVWLGNHWAWAPGRRIERPVYAPALVAFVGGSAWSVSVASGPAVGWVPLGWREPYRPWYRHSRTHLRDVNVTHVTNVTNITNNVTNVRLVNRTAPSAVTVVSRENFVRARPVREAAVRVSAQAAATAPVAQSAPVARPERTSLARSQPGPRPPSEVRTRDTVAVNTPPAPSREVERAERKGKGRDDARVASRDNDDRPRVRVIDRKQVQRVELQAAQAPAPTAAQPQAKAGDRVEGKAAVQAQEKAGPPAQEKAAPQAQAKAPPVETKDKTTPQPQPQAQGKAPPLEAKGNERAREKAAQSKAQEKAASQPQPAPQAERRVPAPPAEVSKRPTFDREMRQVAPQPHAKRDERKAERQERREQAAEKGRDAPAAKQLEQQRAQQQAQEQQAREQQARQREAQQREETRQKAEQEARQKADQQRAQEQQARQRELQQQAEQQKLREQTEQQKAQQLRAQQQAQEQQARQREVQQQAEQQKAQQLRAQQQSQGEQAREQEARERAMQRQQEQQQKAQQQRAQQQAQEQQAARQRAQQQEAQQQAQAARARQQQEAQQQRQQQQQQQREQRKRENADKQQPQASPQQPQQRAEPGREKGRDRQRVDRDKG